MQLELIDDHSTHHFVTIGSSLSLDAGKAYTVTLPKANQGY